MSDAYNGRVPRTVTNLGMIISQIWVLYRASVREALIALILGFLLLLMLYPLFMIGTFGAGDIKLIMILPAYMSFSAVLQTVFVSFVCGACIGLVRMIVSHTLVARLRVLKNYIEAVSVQGRPLIYEEARTGEGVADHKIRFTIPLLIGTAVSFGGFINL